ncbi:MAG: nucleotide exchange factor GrpE [Planctomycetota bacterium]
MGRKTKKKDQAEAEARKQDAESGEAVSELEALRAERDDYHARWQRAAADYQNLRRRELTDSEDRVRRTMQPLLEKMLFVLDYLDMALACPTTNDESKNLAVGVRLTRDQFLQALEQEEVRPIPTAEAFDPALHEATATVERDDLAPGTIVDVVRTGYTWRGDVLRYAHVTVAAEPATGDEAPADDTAPAAEDGQG